MTRGAVPAIAVIAALAAVTVAASVVMAAKRLPGGVRVLDMGKVFTPGGAFRRTMVFRGRKANVRQSDGIHFSTAGASIAATLIIERGGPTACCRA